jgi:hypothetical protein
MSALTASTTGTNHVIRGHMRMGMSLDAPGPSAKEGPGTALALVAGGGFEPPTFGL